MVRRANAVFDTSFWIHSFGVGLLPFVLGRYALRYPPAVALELPERYPSGREFWRMARAGELEEAIPERDQVRRFGPGEREAMNVALEHPNWELLVDDWRPLEWAANMRLRVLSTPVLIVALVHDKEIGVPRALEFLAELGRLGTMMPGLIELARSQLATDEL